jgi:hypothetical protein
VLIFPALSLTLLQRRGREEPAAAAAEPAAAPAGMRLEPGM